MLSYKRSQDVMRRVSWAAAAWFIDFIGSGPGKVQPEEEDLTEHNKILNL